MKPTFRPGAVLASLALAALACKSSSTAAPRVDTATVRLAPAALTSTAPVDAAAVLDRDTSTAVPVATSATLTFSFGHAVEVRRVKVNGTGVRVTAAGLEVSAAGDGRWSASAVASPATDTRFSVTVEPVAPGAALAEIELWGGGLPLAPRDPAALAAATADAGRAAYEGLAMVAADVGSATLTPAGAQAGSDCLTAQLASGALAARAASRAYLVYDADVQRSVVLRRSLNGTAATGGLWLAPAPDVRTMVDELDPERLTGSDTVALCLPAQATAPVHVSRLRLVLRLDDGRDLFDRDAHARLGAALDGDAATALAVPAERVEVGLDRLAQLDAAALRLGAVPAQLADLALLDATTWSDLGPRPLPEESNDLAAPDVSVRALAVTFAGSGRADLPAASVAELELSGSGLGPRVGAPRIVVTYPPLRYRAGEAVGERFGDAAYVAGWAESSAGPGTVEIDGAPSGIGGAFAQALERPMGSTGSWDTVIRARFPDGTEVTRTIHLSDDRGDGLASGAAVAGSAELLYGRENQGSTSGVDAAGGSVRLGTEVSVEIPDGALASRTSVGITRKGPESIPPLDAGMVNVTAPARSAYRFLPRGQQFAKPVTLTLPYDDALLPEGVSASEVKTWFYDEGAGHWTSLPRTGLDQGKRRVVSQTTHFTFMINAVLVLPDHPGPVSFNPNSIKDLKAADPSAGIDVVEAPVGNNQGNAQLTVPIRLPKARGGYQPELALVYDSAGGNGWAGVGWSLKASSISVDTRFGVPYYDGRERYALDGAALVPWDDDAVDHACVDEKPGRRYAARVERDFRRIVRCGTGPSDWRFEVTDRGGTLFVYGASDNARLSSTRGTGEVAEWFLERVVDLDGNVTLFTYDLDVPGSPVFLEDATQASVQHNEPFKQVYLRTIEYTGTGPRGGADALTAVPTPGPYRVEIASVQRNGAHLSRSDALTSARYGFKTLTRRRLDSVRVLVTEKGGAVRGIREYRLGYHPGAFGKALLDTVSVLGAWEGDTGTGAAFYAHQFEYTDVAAGRGAKPFGGDAGAVPWAFDDGADSDPISRSQTSGFGVHGYVGIGWSPTKYTGSAGVRVGYGQSQSATTAAVTDVNGDGLPDRVRARSSGVDARFNAGFDGRAGHLSQVAPPTDPFRGRTLANLPIPTLGSESADSRNLAAQATFGPVTIDVGRSWFSSKVPEYLVDADGDGLVDVISGGTVLFNQPRNTPLIPDCVSDDPSTFCFSPSKWIQSIGAGHASGGVTGENPPDPLDDVVADADLTPSDALVEWLAPFQGNVDVTGALSFVNGFAGTADPRWDGVRLRVYRVTATGGSPAYHTDLVAEVTKKLTDASGPIPVSLPYLDVETGTRLYFVLSTLKNFPVLGALPLEHVHFAPTITYRYACTPIWCGNVGDAELATLDPGAASVFRFDATDDFKLAGAPLGALVVPDDGVLHVRSTLHLRGGRSDDVRLCVQKFSKDDKIRDAGCDAPGGPTRVFRQVMNAGGAGPDVPIVLDLPVSLADRLVFRIESDLAMDPGALDWDVAGELEPASALPPDTDPEVLAFHADAYMPLHLAVSPFATSTDRKSALPSPMPYRPFVAPRPGTLHVYSTVDATWVPDAIFAIRKLDGIVFKGGLADIPGQVDVDLEAGDEVFLEAHGESRFPMIWGDVDAAGTPYDHVLWQTWARFEGGGVTDDVALTVNHTFDSVARDDSDGDPQKFLRIRSPFGGGFHGWRYGQWGGPNDEDIDPSLFEAGSSLSWNKDASDQQQADDAIAAMQDPDNSDAKRARRVAPLLPRRLGTYFSSAHPGLMPGVPAYVSRDGTTFVTATTMHGSDLAGSTQGAGSASAVAAYFKMGSMARASSGDSLSGGLSVGAFGLSAGINLSTGSSRARTDVRDMNGDGIVDVIRSDAEGSGTVRITDLHTLAEHTQNVAFGFKENVRLQENKDLAAAFNMGVSAPIRKAGGAPAAHAPSAMTMPGGCVDGQPGSGAPAASGGGIGSAGGNVGVVTSIGGMYGSIGGGIGVNYSGTRGELIDINGDGLPDAVRREPGEDRVYVRLNLGTRFAEREDVIPAGRWDAGALDALSGKITDSATDPNMVRRTNAMTVMANLGYGDESYAAGVSWESSVAATAVSFVDVNGDGLPDYVRKSPHDGQRIFVMLNTGYGFAREVAWNVDAWPSGVAKPWFRTGVSKVDGIISDISGGPSVDAVEASGTYSEVPTVSFAFTYPVMIGFLTPWLHITVGGDVTPRKISGFQLSMMDVDGDGLPDHVLKAERLDGHDNQSIYVRLNQLGGANLLKRVVRPLGGSVELAYERKGNTVDMPGKRYVLSSVVVRDGRGAAPNAGAVSGHDFVTSYAYAGGYFDRAEREFLGFREVKRTNPDQSVVVQSFRNQSFAVKGLIEREELWNADPASGGKLYVRTDHEYHGTFDRVATASADCRVTTPFFLDPHDYCGSFVTHLKKTTRGLYEGTGAPGVLVALEDAPVRASETYEAYDEYGNILAFLESGDERDPSDDYRATVTYQGGDRAFGRYAVSRPGLVTAVDVARNLLLRKREATYDTGAAGKLKTLTSWIDASGIGATTTLQWFDDGNLQVLQGPQDASGNSYTLTYAYDETTRTYPASILDAHGYSSTAEYDVRFGTVKRTVDVNGNVTRSEFDDFGRLARFYGPVDPATALVAVDYSPGATPPYARTRNRQRGGNSIDTVVSTDGVLRTIQTKKTAEIWTGSGTATTVGWSISGQQRFDAMGRVASQGQTFFEAGSSLAFVPTDPLNPTHLEYDVLGRTTRTIEPNRAETRVSYAFGTPGTGPTRLQAVAVDALQNVRVMYRDASNRVAAVKESTGTSQPLTSYVYDPLGQIVTVVDAAGNRTSLGYDLLGRRTSVESGDTGLVELQFDAAGNLVRKVDSNLRGAGAITYDYDYDHLVAIHYPFSKAVTYEYGKPGADENGAGRIVRVHDDAGEETHGYGKLGELVRSTRTVGALAPNDSPRTFETRFTYDEYGRMRTLVYPDGETLTYAYDAGGLLKSATGDRPATRWRPHETETYLRFLGYDEFGQRRAMALGNGAVSLYEYEPLTRRLHTLNTQSGGKTLQAITYGYDLVGNVKTMVNALGNATGPYVGSISYGFDYDHLYRLTSASGSVESRPGVIDRFESEFEYSDIHNMMRKHQRRRIGVVGDAGTDVDYPPHANHDWAYVYGGKGPHRATEIGDTLVGYDDNGNTAWECRSKPADPAGSASAGGPSDGRIPRCGPHAQHQRLFNWTEENRLSSVVDGPGANTTSFLYDASGDRVAKIGQSGASITVGQYFAVKGKRAASKHVFAGSTRLASKISWEPELDPGTATAAATASLSSAGVVACPVGSTCTDAVAYADDSFRSATYYYHPDHLGSTGWMTDETGRVKEHVEYYPFGEVWRDWRQQEGEPHLAQRFLFTAKEYDEETGLHYFGARYYDARQARWESADPMLGKYLPSMATGPDSALPGFGGVYNSRNLGLYAYAHQNPTTYKDPDGLLTIIVHGTWARDAEYAKPGADFQKAVSSTFKEQAVAFNWSGENNGPARTAAAQQLAAYIQSHLKEGEKLNIVAHSHGGNVVKQYTQMQGAKKIDVLVNLGTPQRDDYGINRGDVGRYVNVYSVNDSVQNKGGYTSVTNPITGKTTKFEAGSAGRTDPTATNKEVSTIIGPKGKPSDVGHSDLHTPAAWQQVAPTVESK